MITKYTLAELQALPTLLVAHTDDLKIETDRYHVWLSRMTVEDGAEYDNQVTIEALVKTREGWLWQTVDQYEAV